MVGWLTALLFALIVVATIKARSQEGFETPPPSGQVLVDSVSSDYQTLLDAYAKAFMVSKITGDQTALTQVKTALTEYQESMKKKVAENQTYIQSFLEEYKNTNPELDALHKKAQTLEEEGPKIADELVASVPAAPVQIDYGGMLTRIGILVLVVGITYAVSVA